MVDVCEALFIPCIQWTYDEHSCPFVSIRGSFSNILTDADGAEFRSAHGAEMLSVAAALQRCG